MSSKRIAVLTTGRQDYGILRSTIHALRRDRSFEPVLWVGGMHLSERFGRSLDHVLADGAGVDRQIPFLGEPPEPTSDASRAIAGIADAITRDRPHGLLVVGDRSEVLAACLAATLLRVPIAHLHGGEETEGAIDNAIRHAITKLSHLHLVTHEYHARRVRQMGEDPSRVVVVGAPGNDNLYRDDLPRASEIASELGIALEQPVVLVTVHPTTLGDDTLSETRAVAHAIESVPGTYIVTAPNADAGGVAIREYWSTWSAGRKNVVLVGALGERLYWGLLRIAAAVLGNSSSGLIEAPAARIPAVNVGDRQTGRVRGPGVIDVAPDGEAVRVALESVLAPNGRDQLGQAASVFPAGPAAPRILNALRTWDTSCLRKRFYSLPAVPADAACGL